MLWKYKPNNRTGKEAGLHWSILQKNAVKIHLISIVAIINRNVRKHTENAVQSLFSAGNNSVM